MKRDSEARITAALTALRTSDQLANHFYKLPDDARNPKPCDYYVWTCCWPAVWLEVKDNRGVYTWPLSDLRPTQRLGMEKAFELGIPYVVAIWWRRQRAWTFVDMATIEERLGGSLGGALRFVDARVWGLEATQERLSSVLAAVLRGELREPARANG